MPFLQTVLKSKKKAKPKKTGLTVSVSEEGSSISSGPITRYFGNLDVLGLSMLPQNLFLPAQRRIIVLES